MDGKRVTYHQFLEGYKAGEIMVLVDKTKAGDFVMSELADKRNKPANLFWTWAGLIVMIPLPIILWIYQGWVYALGSFVLGSMINNAARKSAGEFVLENMLKDKRFWDYVLLHNGAVMQDKEGSKITETFVDTTTNGNENVILDEETKARLVQVVKESKINPQHAQAMAAGSIEALNKADLEE